MERRKTEELTGVLQRCLRDSGLETPLNQYRLVQAWPEVAGELAASSTSDIYIRNQTLFVRVQSPVLRQELLMQQRALVKALNDKVGASVIVEVRFV